jgi:hypothetical protein
MAEGHTMSGGVRARLKKRILHSRNLLLHCLQRLSDYSRTNFARAQITHLLDLEKIKERIGFSNGDQLGLFPCNQLALGEPQNA